jgi:predicted helicase
MQSIDSSGEVLLSHPTSLPACRPVRVSSLDPIGRPKHPKLAQYRDLLTGVTSFGQLEAKISNLETTGERGSAFEVFCEAFLVTQEWINADDLYPVPEKTAPITILERLWMPKKDKGIDGVYVNQSSHDSAYQVKFRTGRGTLDYGELATFLDQVERVKSYETKLILTNCEDVVDEVRRNRAGFVLIGDSRFNELTPEHFREIEAWLKQEPISVKPHSPREDQRLAVAEINKTLETTDRAKCIMACGTGKTLVANLLRESRQPQTTLVLVPSLILLRQTRREWFAQASIKFRDLCVCSDPTVRDKEDQADITKGDVPFPVSTSQEQVREFLRAGSNGKPKVVFCTYQSSPVLGAGSEGHRWDLAIFDEAHKTAGRPGSAFSTALENKHIDIAKRVFFTATPRHCRVGDQSEIYSMNREAQYGPQAYLQSFRKAVELNNICDYKILIPIFSTADVNDWQRRHGEVLVKGDSGPGSQDYVTASQVANQLALAEAVKDYGIRKILSFHSTVATAESFVSDGPEGIGSHLKGFVCRSVNGTMRARERENILKLIEESPQAILSNARCCTEGVDLPALDLVAFLSPKESRIDIVQAAGRAMRKDDGKERGYILVPLYVAITEGETLDEAVERARFGTVLEVLQALKEQDEALADEIREMVQPMTPEVRGGHDWRARERRIEIRPSVSLEHLARSI